MDASKPALKSRLTVFPDGDASEILLDTGDRAAMARALDVKGIRYAHVAPPAEAATLSDDALLAAWADRLDAWCAEAGFASRDLVTVRPDHPERDRLRALFLDEHTHADDEVRWFVDGVAWFFLHLDGHVWRVRCVAGDRLDVPAGTPHWFDMGASPSFRALRLFTDPAGWVAAPTGWAGAAAFRAPA